MKQASQLFAAIFILGAASIPAAIEARGLRDLVRDQRIQTYSVTRKSQDVYESTDGYLILTKYCYEYIYYSDVFFSGGKMYVVDSGETCDVDKIYRK